MDVDTNATWQRDLCLLVLLKSIEQNSVRRRLGKIVSESHRIAVWSTVYLAKHLCPNAVELDRCNKLL
jgi:hypothetical protein